MNRTPLETARHIFSAFAANDIPALLDCLSLDVQWEYGPVSQNVPWYQNRHGIDGAAGFFESLAGCEFHRFEPTTFLGDDTTAVVLVNAEYTVRATGRRVVYEDAAFVIRCNANGEIAKFAHRTDLHQAWLAYNDADADAA